MMTTIRTSSLVKFRARIVLGLLLCGLHVCAVAQSAPTWFDASWAYRAPVTVANGSGGNLSQFQVQIVLDSSFDFARTNQNGSDLRVTDSDGTTVLPIWIQSWNPQQSSATLWARVPNVPSSGTTLYLYYGNPAAVSASSGDATFDFFDDFSYTSSNVPIATATSKAVSWITHAQDAVPAGGVSVSYDVVAQTWDTFGYAEVTGYIIPSIYDFAAATTDPNLAADLRNRAKRMADWELTKQDPSTGSFQWVFDTGQIIEGLVRAYRETGNSAYLNSATRAGDWLISVQSANGSWPTDFGGFAKPYTARVSRALLQLWQASGTSRHRDAAIKNLNWDMAQQQPNGWFPNLGINNQAESSSPLTHTIAYTMEGLLDSGIILNNSAYINSAKKTADAMLGLQQLDGSLTGGNYASDWTPTVADQCLTGSAQTALVWLKLYQYTLNQGSPDSRYLNAAIQLNQYLVRVQGNSSNTGIDGGLAGSDPINGNYQPNHVLSWATKFFLDDLSLETKFVPNATVPIYAIDPAKWSFPSGAGSFSNVNRLLKYTGPSSPRGARVLARKGGTNVTFTNGIVEYSLLANGGFDEMGFMYRGQNPETTNSYVFYPSIWNGQNSWQFYGLESGVETPIATGGGSFTPSTWYAVKAAVGGGSHSFSVNGSQVLTANDSTFSSGTVGLMPWGNAIAWVSNFRLRKFAAPEPTSLVGPEQTSSPGVTSVTLNPNPVAGGFSSTGTVTLNGTTGGVVALGSSNISIATVPGSVTVPAGSSTANFPLTTFANSFGSATISATLGSSNKTASLAVTPAINSLVLNPTSVVGGNASTGTVSLAAAAPAGGVVIMLSSNNPSVASVQSSVTVSAGATSAAFQINTAGVASSSGVNISASYGGSSRTSSLTVTPASLSSLTLNPTSVVGGSPSTATVTLNGAGPPAGILVALSSSNVAAATVPPNVTIGGGASQTSFTVTTNGVSSPTMSTISATYNAVNKTAVLSVGPWSQSWLYRRPITVANSTGATLTNFQVQVTLDGSFSFNKAQTNGGDIRFTSADGVTLLPFWIQSWNSGTSSAVLWVVVPSIPTGGTTLYLYYGNPGAITASNGNATFSFFDDFSYTSGGSPAIDPSKWSFPAGSNGFSNAGGMLQYNGPDAGFGPRAIAMQGGSSVAFTDGVVEYNLQSNGGFDEMGLVYRGQIPDETANSYVFYPSIWNSQNTWLLYARVTSTDQFIANGGVFTPGVWYSAKAAIGGTNHQFFINGTQVFGASDSTFSSGTVGLLAWGNTLSWVTNFRIRKYAASDPTSTVGAEQPAH